MADITNKAPETKQAAGEPMVNPEDIANASETMKSTEDIGKAIAPGLPSSSSPAQRAIASQLTGARGIVSGALAGIGGGLQGYNPQSGAGANIISAFVAGAQNQAKAYLQHKEMLQSVVDATPLIGTYPDIAKKYPMFAGMPTAVALKTIQDIAKDSVDIYSKSKEMEKSGEEQRKSLGFIQDDATASEVANLAKSLGLEAIEPEDIKGLKLSDVIDMMKQRATIDQNRQILRLQAKLQQGGQVELPTSNRIEYADPSLASEHGVPASRPNPYYAMSEKVYTKVRPSDVNFSNKDITAMSSAAQNADSNNGQLQRAMDILNSGLNTGPIAGRIPGKTVVSKDAQEFNQIASSVLPSMRQGMPGAVSDRDMAIFKNANFGLDKDESVNRDIISRAMAINRRISDRAEFISAWANVYGDTRGAQQAWNTYTRANPIFDASGHVNTNSKSYKDYFATASGHEQEEVKQPQATATTPSGVTVGGAGSSLFTKSAGFANR